jgi:hypothetical protein
MNSLSGILFYAVYQEHTLGYVYKGSFGQIAFAILHTSILKGSPLNGLSSQVWLSTTEKLRKATPEDFDDYRVVLPPDFNLYNKNKIAMTELEELTHGKNFSQLITVLYSLIAQGESKGGEIVGHVLHECEQAATTQEQRNQIEAVMTG